MAAAAVPGEWFPMNCGMCGVNCQEQLLNALHREGVCEWVILSVGYDYIFGEPT